MRRKSANKSKMSCFSNSKSNCSSNKSL